MIDADQVGEPPHKADTRTPTLSVTYICALFNLTPYSAKVCLTESSLFRRLGSQYQGRHCTLQGRFREGG